MYHVAHITSLQVVEPPVRVIRHVTVVVQEFVLILVLTSVNHVLQDLKPLIKYHHLL